jgi:threonine dehydrogenase-like Zn-dependent dehydrogenase
MKALVYTQPNAVQLQDRPHPELVPGEVVLKIEAVGICGSDMHAWHGHDPRRSPASSSATNSSAASPSRPRRASRSARASPATR